MLRFTVRMRCMQPSAGSGAGTESRGAPSAADETWPTWFGEDKSLFGWWHIPADRQARAIIVMAPSLARERLAADFSWRLLAASLAGEGYAVLRFDFTATGDSAGHNDHPGLVKQWQEDLLTAVAEARTASAAPVILLGHRVGATLAVQAVRDGMPVDGLVLWDPVKTGKLYLRELAAQQSMAVTEREQPAKLASDTWADVPGDNLTTEAAADLAQIALHPEQPIPVRPLLILTRPVASSTKAFVDQEAVQGLIGLEEMLNLNPLRARTANEPIAETIAWLARTIEDKAHRIEPPTSASTTLQHGGHQIVEHARYLVDGMFGVVTERADGRPDAAPAQGTAVMVSASVEGHTGPGRLWVELARDWAAMGMRVVRCDLPGLGESPPRTGAIHQTVYAPTAIDDLDRVVRALNPQDPGAVALIGMCSGAYNALEVATRLKSRKLILFAFGWWLVPAEFSEGKAPDPARRAFLSALYLLRPLTYTRFGRRLMTGHPERLWLTGSLLRLTAPLRPFRRMLKAGTEITVLLGAADTAYFTKQAKSLERLKRHRGFQFETFEGLDHALLNGEPRRLAGKMALAILEPHNDAPRADH
jgi:alpha-beta hydrolase superfamily lysophospholipase